MHVDHVGQQAGFPDASDILDAECERVASSLFVRFQRCSSGELVREYCDLNWSFVGLGHCLSQLTELERGLYCTVNLCKPLVNDFPISRKV